MPRSKSQKKRENSKPPPSIDTGSRAQKKVKTLGTEGEDWFSAEEDRDLNLNSTVMASSQTPSTLCTPDVHNVSPQAAFTYCLPEDDVLRIAVKTKEIMMEEIEFLVDIKVKAATESYSRDIQRLTNENQQLKDELMSLRTSVDDLEQYSRRNCIRISGIPEHVDESTDSHVVNTAEKLRVTIAPADIDRSHRIGRPLTGKPRDIIVKFTNYHIRQNFFQRRKELKGSSIYINEDLTKARNSLAFTCRLLVRDKRLYQTWAYDGNIFVKDTSGVKHRIHRVSDLERFK